MRRRAFLKRGLFGGALLTAGALPLGLWGPVELPDWRPRRPLVTFDQAGFAVLVAVAARVVQAPGADPVEIAHRVDEGLARAVPELQADLRGLLRLFDNALAGLLLDGRFRPFTRLPPEAQDAVLLAWRDSRFVLRRGGYQALRKLTLAEHYGSPETWASVGYPGPPEIAQ